MGDQVSSSAPGFSVDLSRSPKPGTKHTFGRRLCHGVGLCCVPAGWVSWQCRHKAVPGQQAMKGQPQFWPPLATGLSHTRPHLYLFRLENAPESFLRSCQVRSAQSFETCTAQGEHCSTPPLPPHRLPLLEQIFPAMWFGVRDFLFSLCCPGRFSSVPPGKFPHTHRHLPSAPGRDPAWAQPPAWGKPKRGGTFSFGVRGG